MKTTKKEKLRGVAAILTVIGGTASAVCGGVIWVPYVVTGIGYGWVFPLFGFISFALGMLIILGGIFIIRDRDTLGGHLAIWCGFAGIFGGYMATAQTLSLFLHFYGIALGVLSITLTLICPVVGGVLSIIYRGSSSQR